LVFVLRFGAPETCPRPYAFDALADGCADCGFFLGVLGFGREFVRFDYLAVFVFYDDLVEFLAAV
jgi:hypothetical protein